MSQTLTDLTTRLDRPDLTREALWLLFAQLLESEYGARDLTFVADGVLSYSSSQGQARTFHLHNLWRVIQDAEEPRIDILKRYAVAALPISEEGKTHENVVATIKDSVYRDMLGPASEVEFEHLAADLWIVYAFDLPQTIVTLSKTDRLHLNLSSQELRPLAVENLERILPQIERHGDGSWFLLTAGGDYVASMLLLDELWLHIADLVEGDLVAAVPTRDVLLVTGSNSSEGIAAIRERALNLHAEGDHVISPTLLRRVADVWKAL